MEGPSGLLFVPDDRPFFSLTETSHPPACLLLLNCQSTSATFRNSLSAACTCIIMYLDVMKSNTSVVVSLEAEAKMVFAEKVGFEMKGDNNNWSHEW